MPRDPLARRRIEIKRTRGIFFSKFHALFTANNDSILACEQWHRNEFKTGGHGKNCRAPPLFGFTSTLSRFVEHFRDGQYSLVSFLFAVLRPVPSHLNEFR